MRRGLLVVVSSPSGAGKTTLCRRLLQEFPDLKFSVSYTTRPPRTGERNGVDYWFVDAQSFQRMVEAGEFAEWAEVHGNRYGTARAAVEDALVRGHDVLFDIDWQGGEKLKAQFAGDAVMVWVLPPSLQVLEERLRRRATDAPDVIGRRLAMAKEELLHYTSYDYLIVNDAIENAYDHLRSIYVAVHWELRRARFLAAKLLETGNT
ncbi:MAG: guanylate kinase [Deltaproteobacteria bacterium]|nr:guanylate kinase [Deltaproteobacteria bacterium]